MVPRSQFSCLYGLSLQIIVNQANLSVTITDWWSLIFFLLLQRKRYHFRTLDLHGKQACGQLRKTLFSFIDFLFLFPPTKSILFLVCGLPFCSIHIPHVFIGSSSWIDFTNPEIRKWWASKFALSEYQVIWKFLFNGSITSPTSSLVKNRHH